jgi:integrase
MRLRIVVRRTNVLSRQIKAVLDCCHCGKAKAEHRADEHEFRRDGSLPVWRGWHGFRRGLATNLNRLGVQDKTIQSILRHSNLATTMNVYVQTVGADTVTAMRTLEALMCAERAPGATFFPSTTVN